MIGNNKKTILITGINGFLGSHLAKKLFKDFRIIGLEYQLENLFRIENMGLKVYSSQEDNIEDIFINENIFAVIHTATVYRRQGEPIKSLLDTNILLPVLLFEFAEKYNVNRFINTDTFFNTNSNKNYNYLQDYTLSKNQALEWLKLLSKNCLLINMKIFHMYGSNDANTKFVPFVINKLKNNENIDLTGGEQTRDFIYIEDVAEAYRTVLISDLSESKEFDVCTGKSISIREFVETAKSVINSTSILGWGVLPYRENEIMNSKGNMGLLNELGWKPKYDFKEGLLKTILD